MADTETGAGSRRSHPGPSPIDSGSRYCPHMRSRGRTSSAWAIGIGGSREERLRVALDPRSRADDLAAIAPGYQDPSPDLDLIMAVLAHPEVSEGLVARYATCADEGIRQLVVEHPACPSTAFDVLAADAVPSIRIGALRRLQA